MKNQRFFNFPYYARRFNLLNNFKRMPRRLRNLNRALYEANNDGAGGGSGADNQTGTDGNPTDGAGKQDGENKNPDNGGASIPKYRFDEVNNKYKAAQAELDAIKAEKAKQAEAEALKRGEHEKLLAQKESELEAYKTKEAIRKQREEELTSKNNARVEALKTSYGDKWGTVSNLLHDGDDAFITSKTLDAIEAMKPTEEKKEDNNQAPK